MTKIQFTGGKTPPETFPYDGLAKAANNILKKLRDIFSYYPTQHEYSDFSQKGYRPLREVASIRFRDREGVNLPVDNIILTNGSMQALELLGRTFIKPRDIVITEELTYYGTLRFFRYLDARIVGISLDEDEGMNVDHLEDTLKHLDRLGEKPKFIYVLPNNHNPTGADIPESRLKRIRDVAAEYGILVVEDDCYGDLDFIEKRRPRSILAVDDGSNVIYVATFSKIVAPAVRIGYFYAPDKYIDRILEHRWDIGSSLLSTAILAEYLRDNLWSQVKRQVNAIKMRYDVLTRAMDEYLSDYAEWTRPKGGLFLWVKLKVDVDMDKLEAEADKLGVYFDSGWKFHYRMKKIKAFRLSYAHLSPEDIIEGVKRISEAIKNSLK